MKTKRICWFSLVLVLFVFLFQVVNVYAVILDGFDYPIGIPDHSGWYNLQGFLINNHLGEDWNILGTCPEDSSGATCDIGKSVYAIANGKVIESGDYPGWGNIIMIKHDLLPWDKEDYEYVVSMYAHLGDNRQVSENEYVRRGQLIGYIGSRSENGGYSPHLHLELRSDKFKERFTDDTYRGCGYLNNAPCNITDSTGWLDPSDFIEAHRPSILPLSGDWNNDGVDTTGTFTPGTTCGTECQAQGGSAKPPKFSLDNGAPIEFGQAGDYPIIGDWDNDGYDEIGLWRLFKSHAKLYLDSDNNGGMTDKEITFDYPENIPITGDWDGENGDDLGGYDASVSIFYLHKLNYQAGTITLYNSILFGDSTKRDYPIIGDWDNDGKDDLGVFRARFPNNSTNTFFLAKGQTTETNASYEMGNVGDIPFTGDWDGDGDDNIGLYRPATGEFFLEPNIPTTNQHPVVSISTDKTSYAPNDTLTFYLSIHNPGPEKSVDIYFSFTFPSGREYFLANDDWISSPVPYLTSFTFPPNYHLSNYKWFSWTLPNWKEGEHAFKMWFTEPGTSKIVGKVARASFVFGPDKDEQAKEDMINESQNDFRFGSYISGSFGKNLDWYPEWELRWMDFDFYGGRIVRIWHATKKTDSSIRYTIFWDPDVHSWTDWIKAK